MKKFAYVFVMLCLLAVSGCVNKTLLDSSTAYQESTEPYLEMVLRSDMIKEGEKNSLRANMKEFKQTIDKYNTNKAWYEL